MKNSFRTIYDKLPEADKDRVMELLMGALHYRGHDRGVQLLEPGFHATDAVVEIAKIASANGMEILEYN